jgi:hypothetical protein
MRKQNLIFNFIQTVLPIFFFLATVNINAQGNVTLPTVNGLTGTQILAPINVSNLPNGTVAFQFTLPYNNSIIYITGVDVVGTMLAGAPPTVNPDTLNGRIMVAWATGTTPLQTTGILLNLKIKFRNLGSTVLTTTVQSNQTFLFNDIPANVTNGSATTSLIQQYTITTSSNPSNGGTTSGGGTFNSGQSVTVNATPNSGYNFVNWTEGSTVVSTSASYTFNASSNRNLVANFTQQYSVNASANPFNGGTITGAGLYNPSQSVTVTATPNTGYNFVNWMEGSNVVSTNPSYTFTINSNRNLVANFAIVFYSVTTSANPGAGGTTSGTGTYTGGQSVTVIATANSGYSFVNWTEGTTVVSTDASYTFTINASRSLVANFALNQFTVATLANPSNGGTTTGGGSYNPGSSVTVTATPANGYTFFNWTEGIAIVSTSASYTFTIAANRALVANFTPALYAVTIQVNPPGGGTTTGSGFYNFGQIVQVTATANSGYQFVNWTEGSTVVSTGASYAFLINGDKNFKANFVQLAVLSVAPNFVNVNYPTGTSSFNVSNTGGSTMNWTAVSNDSWITITSGGSGTNSGTINFSYAANSGASRTGTITVTSTGALGSPRTVEVRQAAFTDVRELNDGRPSQFYLFQNFPNPFNPDTKIKFSLPKESMVRLKVFNLIGQELAQLVNQYLPAGTYIADFDGSSLNSGIYIYKLQTESFVQMRKMVLMK